MIKFFRRIRQQLLTENKFSKYLLYAIGEIFLVVIGILIALWINTLNQEKEQQKKIDSILVKIQNDMLQDIDNADWLIENYMRKDSIYTRMMDEDLTPKDIKAIPLSGSYSLDFVTTWWMTYQIQPNGYNLLKENIAIVPKNYDELIKTLDEMYTYTQNVFETYNTNSEDIAKQYKQYLNTSQPWNSIDDFNRERSDEQIDFILNNPRFKNQMNAMLGSVISMIWEYTAYKKDIITTYIKINELLGEKARPLPSAIRTTSVTTAKDAEDLIGIYQFKEGRNNIYNDETIEVYLKDKDLYIKTKDRERGPLLHLDVENSLFSNVRSPVVMKFNPKKNILKVYIGNYGINEWVKVTAK